MTSREATGPWVRSDDNFAASLSDRAMVGLFGALQWPWLLRSLFGGKRSEKRQLLRRLDLPGDALPNLGSWKADTIFLEHIVDAIEWLRPETVVEIGCGASSLVIAKALQANGGGQLISYDQHQGFAKATSGWLREHGLDAEIRHAPLGSPPPGWPGHWYQLDHVPHRIDLLVIDGPPWAVHPFVRGAAEVLFDRIGEGGMVLLDDAARPGERIIASRWKKRWPAIDFRLDSRGAKGTLIGVKRGAYGAGQHRI